LGKIYIQYIYFVLDRLLDSQERVNDQAKWCGLSQNENQRGRKFDEICRIHGCICKESKKKITKNNDEKDSATKMLKLCKPKISEICGEEI